MAYQWISFTTDYGLDDGFVAACRGVVGRIAADVTVVDVTHAVPPQDVRRGAEVLAQTAPYLPQAVHLAVVDPGVGTDRRGVALLAPRGALVGPDNGLLLPAADALGGVLTAYELTEPEFWLAEVSRTFHGRDVFAPVAAHLAVGVRPERLGRPLPVGELVRLPEPVCRTVHGRLETEVLAVDRFGNVQLAARPADLLAAPGELVRFGADDRVRYGGTFADVPRGEPVLIEDSAGRLALAVNGGSAATAFAVQPGDVVVLGG
ncbi:SAM-dependent chlorinase/fluorinase [Solihabitans fulvus]|uniref:SAM-dependent chlorinase/fluorinase n=1 Tax=Solihabitans fulvus TaxID=1892852 RepID=A0A5B2WU90_9PSEU|nr:SAM-dependent chlorinase/fluorinase [Solihabitans fulvus]KAA2254292.1 SAM-dependent chlorinase/fluorinase [Solihabitans fulvus]